MPLLEDDAAIRRLLRSSHAIAVVGFSDKPHRDSFAIGHYLLSHGYAVYPVNPAIDSVLGMRSYPALSNVDAPIDIVDIFRRPEFVPPIVEAAVKIGARAVWFQLGVTHPEASSYATRHGLEVVEDRCIMVEHRRLIL
jgi:predicted CoA-binding protein